MSITVNDCLKLPALRNCKVLAGEKGLDHIVSNASVLEIYDESLFNLNTHINNSVLILASFESIADDYDKQCRHLENLFNMGSSAIVIYYVGIFLKEIHPSLIDTANRLNFPLIVMPEKRMDCFFCEALSDVYEAIFDDRSKRKDLINSISALVTRLPDNKKNLPNLLRLISDDLKCTVLLSDSMQSNICIAKWPTSNDITEDEIYALFRGCDAAGAYYGETVWNGGNLHIFYQPFTAVEYRNISIYVVDEFGNVTSRDVYSIVELLQLFSRLWDLDTTDILENSLISTIIEGDSVKMRQIAEKLPINIHALNTAVFLRPDSEELDVPEKLHLQRNMVRIMHEHFPGSEKNKIIDIYGPLIVGFSVFSSDADSEALQELIMQLDTVGCPYTLSVFSCDNDAEEVHKTFLLYNEVIPLAVRIFPRRKLFSYGDILFVRQCNTSCKENGETIRICRNILRPIFEESDSQILLETLAAYYLDANCQLKSAADRLYIHRNTVQYRLAKIHSITNFNADDPLSGNLMYQAIACWRLHPELFD